MKLYHGSSVIVRAAEHGQGSARAPSAVVWYLSQKTPNGNIVTKGFAISDVGVQADPSLIDHALLKCRLTFLPR